MTSCPASRSALRPGAVARYAAFVFDLAGRYRRSPVLRAGDGILWNLLEAEERRLRADHPEDWAQGVELSQSMTSKEFAAGS